MTRLKGKVISRPLIRVSKEGEQVMRYKSATPTTVNMTIEVVEHISDDGKLGFKSKGWQTGSQGLYKFYIEYKKEAVEPWLDWKSVVVPLKYSQWQAAIDNNEVDSDKEVEFELSRFNSPNGNGATGLANTITLAKIIPAKRERLYTKVELDMKCKMAHHYGTIGRKFEDFIELHLK